ncbi:MAG: FliA/WhiG family RNA polymerase sigma factor [Syntrophobacteraceae bacterium]
MRKISRTRTKAAAKRPTRKDTTDMKRTDPVWKNSCDTGTEGHSSGFDREGIIREHRPLVRYIALRLAARLPNHISVEDLISAGTLGLMDAIEKYDSNQRVPFECYAKIRIKGAMLDEVRAMDWVPRSLRQKSSILEKACVVLEKRLGRDPTEEEIASELGLDIDEFYKLLNEVKGISFLPENIHEVISESRESHILASEPEELFNAAYRKEIQQHLAEAIETLSSREQLVLSLYYYEELAMREIGAVMGCTESRIYQIHTRVMAKLRGKLSKRLSHDDLPGYIASESHAFQPAGVQLQAS